MDVHCGGQGALISPSWEPCWSSQNWPQATWFLIFEVQGVTRGGTCFSWLLLPVPPTSMPLPLFLQHILGISGC